MERVFEIEQWIPRKPAEVFPFFCEARNLEVLTPPWLNFKILNQSTPTIQKGTLFDYSLRIHGIPVKWRTLIEDWQENESFVDTQLRGPYRLWHHTHIFTPDRGGTLMKDRVRYALPFGVMGDFLAARFVRRDVEGIFAYRKEAISKFFK